MVKHLTLVFLSLILFSCVTRKAAISKSYVESRVDSVVSEKKDSVSVQNNGISVEETTDEIEIVPIDTSKPIIVGGKEYFNASVKIKKTHKKSLDTSKVTVSKSSDNQIKFTKSESKDTFIKTVDKKPSYFNLWWLLLIPLVIWAVKRFILKF
jgi:hypothetical protein